MRYACVLSNSQFVAPSSVEAEFRRAADAYRLGKIDDAERRLRKVLASSARHIEAHFILGMLLGHTGRWAEALVHLDQVLHAQPMRQEALFWVALANRSAGRAKEAATLFERVLAKDPKSPVVLNELGLCRMALSEPEQAQQAFARAIKSDPRTAVYHLNSGLALKRLDQFYKARDAFQEAANLEPRWADTHIELAQALKNLGQDQDAVAALKKAVKAIPADPRLRTALAAAQSQVGERKEAEDLFRSTMAAHPSSGIAFAEWLQQEGRFQESVDATLESLRVMPLQGVAYYRLAEAKTFTIDGDSWIPKAESLLDSPALDLREATYLRYALARAYDKVGDAEKTIHYYDLANTSAYALHNSGRPFNCEEVRRVNDEIVARYTADLVQTPYAGASDTDQPIFIVGMIRSGTTLLDQIISSHPLVKSAGEPVFWMKEADRLRNPTPTPSEAEVQDIAKNYRASIEAVAGESQRITDKMPLNYSHIGLIHRIFPNAKIIHIRRDPLDTCFSIYTTFFGQGPNFAYNQSNIAFNYREYLFLMEHWRQVMPLDTMIEVEYEELIDNREETIRRVLEFCNLEWDDACLSHERNESAVLTPSKWQARQPIYRTSIQRWKQYEPWLGALLELKDAKPRSSGQTQKTK